MKWDGDLRTCRLVEVTWRDAHSLNVWASYSEASDHGPIECKTVGYLIPSGKREVKLCQNINYAGHVGNVMAIPREWVTRVKTLKRGKR